MADDAMAFDRYDKELARLDKALALLGKDVEGKLDDDDRREIEGFVETANGKILSEMHRQITYVRDDVKAAVGALKTGQEELKDTIRQERRIEFGEFEAKLFEKMSNGKGGLTGIVLSFSTGTLLTGGILFMLWLNGMLGG